MKNCNFQYSEIMELEPGLLIDLVNKQTELFIEIKKEVISDDDMVKYLT